MDDSSDEMEEPTPPSSFTVPISSVEVKTEKTGVDGVDKRASNDMQVDRVEKAEQLSTDSGSSVVGTHPVFAIADIVGVHDVRPSAVSGGSSVGRCFHCC